MMMLMGGTSWEMFVLISRKGQRAEVDKYKDQ
jgi:hypothetical protein